MPLIVHQFPCLSDNYGYLVRDEASGLTACIDTPQATPILAQLERLGWRLTLILNTHWHLDHAGGNDEIRAATGAQVVAPAEVRKTSTIDREVRGGDQIVLGETTFQVIGAGGHTLGHVAYYDPVSASAFVGDTLFALGCGRMFEGDADQMWASLQKLAALPDDTRIYCAHEYTASNARFALSVDPGEALRARAEAIFAARARGEPTVPSTLAEEKATNPFLRAPLLAGAVGAAGLADAQAFAALRAAKDMFKG